MKKELILLAERLITDDNFALEFSSKQSTDEKFELVKTNFSNIDKENFLNFLKVLQNLEDVPQKLSLENLENISGGIGNNKLKLAALTFLGLIFTPMGTSGIASADQPIFYTNINNKLQNYKKVENVFKEHTISAALQKRRITSQPKYNEVESELKALTKDTDGKKYVAKNYLIPK